MFFVYFPLTRNQPRLHRMRDWLASYIMLNKSKRNNIKHITHSRKSNSTSAGVSNPPGPGTGEASEPDARGMRGCAAAQ